MEHCASSSHSQYNENVCGLHTKWLRLSEILSQSTATQYLVVTISFQGEGNALGNNHCSETWQTTTSHKLSLTIRPVIYHSQLCLHRIDIQTNVRRFQSFFQYLLVEVALDSERLEKIPPQAQRDLFLLLSRVILFYNSDDKLESFFKQFPDFPNAFLVGSAADIFVIELADQLQKLKVEPVLLHYLSRINVLQGLELRLATSTRLKTCLYSFTTPGGPMYPTRAVRHAAWDALDFLFPVGRYPRHLISLFFRLLYPWYWPSSCWNFVLSCIQAVMYSLLRLIFSGWEKLRPKQS